MQCCRGRIIIISTKTIHFRVWALIKSNVMLQRLCCLVPELIKSSGERSCIFPQKNIAMSVFSNIMQPYLREYQQRWQSFTASHVHWYCMCLKCHTVFSPQQTFFSTPACSVLVSRFLSDISCKAAFWGPRVFFSTELRCWPTTLAAPAAAFPKNSGELLAPGSWLFYSHCFGTHPRLKPLQVIRRLFK